MKHLRTISVAKANEDIVTQFIDIFLADLRLRFIDFLLYQVLGLPEPQPSMKET